MAGHARASGGQSASALWKRIHAGGWGAGLQLQTPDLAAGSGEAQKFCDRILARGVPNSIACGASEERRYQLAGIDPAASNHAIPKRAGALAAGGSS